MNPTINQINSFCINNGVLKHFLAWRQNENLLAPAWREDLKYERSNGLQRKTFRGNCIYGNVLKSVGAFCKVDLSNYNYQRDRIQFNLSVQYTVKLDIDGVWIQAEMPWAIKNEWGYDQRARLSDRLRANVPFEREALSPIIDRIDAKYFFPESTLLGKIQIARRTDKIGAIQILIEHIKGEKHSNSFIELIEEPVIQKAIARKLRRNYNIDAGIHTVNRALFNELAHNGRRKELTRIERFDMSDFFDFDGDVDELENAVYSKFEDNVIYL